MTKDELETAIKMANLWSGRSTLVLAIGILGEYALLPFLEKKSWLRAAKIFFAILVVAGIIGEYEFSSRISQHSYDLQRISDGELKDATDKAAASIERSAKLETTNKQLGIDLEAEKQKTARFQKEAARSQLEIAKYVALFANNTNPRSTNFDANKFVEAMKGPPKLSAEIWYESDDPESETFAANIARALDGLGGPGALSAGWEEVRMHPFVTVPLGPASSPELKGLFLLRKAANNGPVAIAVRDLDDSRSFSLAIKAALSYGIRADISILDLPWLPPMHLTIGVGHHVVNIPTFVPTPAASK